MTASTIRTQLLATRGRQRAAAFVLGALSILSMAPFFLWPILWLTLPGLLWLIAAAETLHGTAWRYAPWQRSAIGRAAETGWWFGFGYHLFGLFWIGEAFLVEAEIFAWLLPFAVAGLPAGLALFTVATCAFVSWVAPVAAPGRDGSVGLPLPRVLALAIGFGVTEWLRGHILTGFPWNVLGYALTAPHMIATAGWVGIYSLTVVAVLVSAGSVLLWQREQRWGAACLSAGVPLLGTALSLTTTIGAHVGEQDAKGGAPIIRIVQPSVPQREKWRPENQRRIFDEHLALSDPSRPATVPQSPAPQAAPSLIVWPEAAMPFLPLNEPVAMAEIGRLLPEGVTLASGALRADPPTAPGERRRVFNSLLVFGQGEPSARVLATYDKTHLVPFGEYLPLQRVLEAIGLQQLSRMRGGFASGPEPRPLLDVPGVGRLAPLICYEAIFPGRVVQTLERPRAFLNVTNDGWFGNTTGPRQHLHMARVRAVEEGVPVIRAANNGVSAIIDANGRITAKLDLNVRGAIDARLPPSLAPPLYARTGDALFWALTALLGVILMQSKRENNP